MIEKFWNSGNFPLLNAIFYRNNKYKNIEFTQKGGEKKSFVTGHGSISEIPDTSILSGSSIAELFTKSSHDEKYIYSCGEASWGSEGYIACIRKIDHSLDWLAIFDNSNPFNFIELKKNSIHFHSTLNEIWKVNIKNPSEIIICKDL